MSRSNFDKPFYTVELCCGYPKPDTFVRENPKIGRNDPCPVWPSRVALGEEGVNGK